MVTQFLSGMLVAWAVAQVALGALFSLAHALSRRETEYLLFGLAAMALAVATLGTGIEYGTLNLDIWRWGTFLADVGLILAVPLHLHFLLDYSKHPRARTVARAAYAVAGVFLVLRLSGFWEVAGSEQIRSGTLLGVEFTTFEAVQLPHAMVFYGLAGVTVAAGSVILFRVYRSGRREALFAWIASALLVLAIGNDLLVVGGLVRDSVYLWPHAFLLYALSMASTLLFRYRKTAGELEQTAHTLSQRIAELDTSYEELSEMEHELDQQRQLAAVGQLAASIAHEVRNPLAVIVNAVAGLRRARLSEQDHHALLAMIDEEVARLNGLVTDLLRFARPVRLSRSRVDLRELLERLAGMLEDQHRLELSVPDDPKLAALEVDASLLEQALNDLIENACQAMPNGGVIRIGVRAGRLGDDRCIRIDVQDNGKGMNAKVLSRAIEPFFSTRSSATGLGLPIVKRIIEAHGGEVVINSEPGVGTTVGLLIPEPGSPDAAPDRVPRRPRRRWQTVQ